MNNFRQKKLTLGILLVGILVLSVGFAAYSASLRIKSTASFTPDASNFDVVFSKISTGVDTGDLLPDTDLSNVKGGTATLDGTTISNLGGDFTKPDQKVVYKFYAYNRGQYEAFLNSITFLGNKTCTSTGEGTTEVINAACDSIKMTVQVGDITTSVTKQNITGESIKPKKSTLIMVTIEYASDGTPTDGPFTVKFSDVSLYYASKTGINEEIKPTSPIYGTQLVQHIENLYTPNATAVNNNITYNIDTTNGIIDDGLGGTVSSGGNLRYYGANPNNYIDIGDRDENNNPILWRIIGLFETKYATEELPCDTDSDSDGHFDNCASDKLVKIIRNDSIGSFPWDTELWTGYNDWSISTVKRVLNDAYYNSTTITYEWLDNDSDDDMATANFTDTGLNSTVHSKIETILWNLGGHNTAEIYSNEMYGYERGTNVYSGHSTEWVGKVGLMYPSDYGYATDLTKCSENLKNYSSSTDSYVCRTNDWLYTSYTQWNITPRSDNDSSVFGVNSTGNIATGGAFAKANIRPVLYLKSDITLSGGTGDDMDPYVLEGISSSDNNSSTNQVFKPQFYSWSSGEIGDLLPYDARRTASELNSSYPFYIGLDADVYGNVTATYVCFVRNDTEYCLRGASHQYADTNVSIVEDAFKDVENACTPPDGYELDDDYYSEQDEGPTCSDNDLRVSLEWWGNNSVSGFGHSCSTDDIGSFECH